jgi:hypothetical protein
MSLLGCVFKKRLPKTCIPFNSEKGKELFLDSLNKGPQIIKRLPRKLLSA